jgi:Chitobiase/beta-hexosaminidase C-terminal domain
MKKAVLFYMLTCAVLCAQRQTPLDSSHGGGGVVPSGTPLFSQTGSSLTIHNCQSGQSVLYRTDGGPVTIASKLYSGPLTVTTGEVVVAICATEGAYQTNAQADVASAQCHTIGSVGTGNGTPCDSSGSGYGTLAFASVAWNVASSATITATTQATAASSTQGLFIHFFGGSADPSAPTCDSCTTQVEDFVLTASAGSSTFMNIETDTPQYDYTHSVDRQNGLQCNQHSDHDWEIDSGNAGGWHDTGYACSYAAGVSKEVVLRVAHVNGDTGCGGNGCANYTDLYDNGTHYALCGSCGGTQGYNSQSGGKAYGAQVQPDFQTTSGTALTGTITLSALTVALGTGDESATKSYTAF